MSKVFVLDANRKPLNPVHPALARILLDSGKAAVLRYFPFTLILNEGIEQGQEELRVKIDPGSKVTGIAVINDATGEVVWAAELQHRGKGIKAAIESRSIVRRSRRNRQCRHRQARFQNRRRQAGWLPPSLESRVSNVITWVNRLRHSCPIGAISLELVKFDTQALQNPEISGIEYQQGELQGYEVREYLLEKWGRKCAYCGAQNVPFEVDHIVPCSRQGSDRVSNLCLACHDCNQAKGNKTAAEFGHPEVQKQARLPLRDAAAVNTTRWALYRRLLGIGLPVEVGTGGRTKFNRIKQRLPKWHWIDAACVGATTPKCVLITNVKPFQVRACGYGNRQMCVTDRHGFPIRHRSRKKGFFGFQTGDIVRAHIPNGKFAGVHVGRVIVRQRPYFQLSGFDVNIKYITRRQCNDGYAIT